MAMITMTREFADRVADVVQLLEGDEIPDEALHRLTALAAELVPGGTAAAVTIAMASGALIFAASDQRLEELRRLQLDGAGPVVETLRHNEPSAYRRRRSPYPARSAAPHGRAGVTTWAPRSAVPAQCRLKLIVVCSRLAPGRSAHRKRTPVTPTPPAPDHTA